MDCAGKCLIRVFPFTAELREILGDFSPIEKSSFGCFGEPRFVEKLKEFQGELIIQTLFVRGTLEGKKIDNTAEKELSIWLKHIKAINPKYVMIYPIDRATPLETLEKVPFAELVEIAERVEKIGIRAQVYY